MAHIHEGLPIYIRLAEMIKNGIVAGVYPEESQIPSRTVLSKEGNYNIATVNKAVNLLVDEGLLYKKRGVGMFVKPGAVNKLVNSRKKVFKERFVAATLLEAKHLGLSLEELQAIVKEAYDEIR